MNLNSKVYVKYNSEYATITPVDDCIDIEDSALLQSLEKHSLLKYKQICIHCKRW